MTTINQENNYRRQLYSLSDEEFYFRNPELAGFDGGEGLFTLKENRSVGFDEFIAYGKQREAESSRRRAMESFFCDNECKRELSQSEIDPGIIGNSDALKRAALDLKEILEKKGSRFARYYIRNVMDRDLARSFIYNYGEAFYRNEIPERIVATGPGFTRHPSEFLRSDACHILDRFDSFPDGSFRLSLSVYEVQGKCLMRDTDVDFHRSPSSIASLNTYNPADGKIEEFGPSGAYAMTSLFRVSDSISHVACILDAAGREAEAFGVYLFAELCKIYA